MRQVQCPNCGELMDFSTYQGVHLNIGNDQVCSKYEGPCPYKCGVEGNVNVRNHTKECPQKPIVCQYFKYGCLEIVTKENIDSHLSKEAAKHAELENTENENKILQNQLESVPPENDSSKSVNGSQNNLTDLFKQTAANQDPRCDERLDDVNGNSKISNIMKSQKANDRQEIDSQNLVARNDNVVHRNGVYIWKIHNFSNLKAAAEKGEQMSITSDPFYTKQFDYKMCMKIYPDGDEIGKGTHLSVYFVLMQGEYDDLLSWPFKNKVKITLLNHRKKPKHHVRDYKPNNNSSCFEKPEKQYNLACGAPQFITLSKLFHADNKFMVNDQIFLKIEVSK